MSRIGKKPVAIPSGVDIKVEGSSIVVKGSKGELQFSLHSKITVSVEGDTLTVLRADDTEEARARHGLSRAIIANMVTGVSDGYEKKLEIIGVGYKAQLKGKTLDLSLGFSHPVLFPIPEGIEITQDEKNKNILIIRGIDKQLVGETAARIRRYRPPEPYKGKGIKYTDEVIRRKVGKASVSKV
jgi:large subunit ribosomal protein L6